MKQYIEEAQTKDGKPVEHTVLLAGDLIKCLRCNRHDRMPNIPVSIAYYTGRIQLFNHEHADCQP